MNTSKETEFLDVKGCETYEHVEGNLSCWKGKIRKICKMMGQWTLTGISTNHSNVILKLNCYIIS